MQREINCQTKACRKKYVQININIYIYLKEYSRGISWKSHLNSSFQAKRLCSEVKTLKKLCCEKQTKNSPLIFDFMGSCNFILSPSSFHTPARWVHCPPSIYSTTEWPKILFSCIPATGWSAHHIFQLSFQISAEGTACMYIWKLKS